VIDARARRTPQNNGERSTDLQGKAAACGEQAPSRPALQRVEENDSETGESRRHTLTAIRCRGGLKRRNALVPIRCNCEAVIGEIVAKKGRERTLAWGLRAWSTREKNDWKEVYRDSSAPPFEKAVTTNLYDTQTWWCSVPGTSMTVEEKKGKCRAKRKGLLAKPGKRVTASS